MEAPDIQGPIRESSRVSNIALSLAEVQGKLRPQRYHEVCQTVKFIQFICTSLQFHILQGWFPLWVCGYDRVLKVVEHSERLLGHWTHLPEGIEVFPMAISCYESP